MSFTELDPYATWHAALLTKISSLVGLTSPTAGGQTEKGLPDVFEAAFLRTVLCKAGSADDQNCPARLTALKIGHDCRPEDAWCEPASMAARG